KVGGNYIQVNTQFATFNHKMGLDNYLRMISRMKEWRDVYTSDAFLEDLRRLAASEERTANAFVEMVRRVAEVFPEKRVVVRPHPMEGREFYLSGLSGIANVLVTNEGPVRPWLASADAVIHHSCTTGVEALLMNKNVIRFTPYQDGASCNMQANVGKKTETVDELIQALRQGAMPSEERAAQLDLIRPHVANCTELATPQIASHVARLAGEEPTWLPEPLSPWEAAKAWRKHFSKVLRSHQPGRNGRKVRYALEKFPRLTLSRINSLIRTIRSCDQDIPEVDVAELGLNVFLLKPATADNQRKNHGI
ncbi:MAG: hypothetical protein PWQ57_542, partial [Desulfovibrionales bacterium]|nr:hypothetical protein [Desulfovibrionales bacterium]